MLRPHLPVVVLLASGLLLPTGCARRERVARRPPPARAFHVQLSSTYDDHGGARWSVLATARLQNEPGCAALSPRAQARFGETPLFVVAGGMHDAPGLNFFGEQRCGEPSASGTVELPAQEEGPAVSRQMVLRDGARLLQADVKLGHWRLLGEARAVRPGEQVVLEWNLPEAPPRELQVTLTQSLQPAPVPFQLQGARLSVRLPANLQPGAPYSLSLSTKVENAVSGCVGAPRCTASLVHEERRVLSVR